MPLEKNNGNFSGIDEPDSAGSAPISQQTPQLDNIDGFLSTLGIDDPEDLGARHDRQVDATAALTQAGSRVQDFAYSTNCTAQAPSSRHGEARDLPAKRPPLLHKERAVPAPNPASEPALQKATLQDDGRTVHYLSEFPETWLLPKGGSNVSSRPSRQREGTERGQPIRFPAPVPGREATAQPLSRSRREQEGLDSRVSGGDVVPPHPAKRTKLFLVAHGRLRSLDLGSSATDDYGSSREEYEQHGAGESGAQSRTSPARTDATAAAAASHDPQARASNQSSSSMVSTHSAYRGPRRSHGDAPLRLRRMISSD